MLDTDSDSPAVGDMTVSHFDQLSVKFRTQCKQALLPFPRVSFPRTLHRIKATALEPSDAKTSALATQKD